MVQSGVRAITVAFRVDASLQIGTGHVMRCLTLADALKAQGAQCHFLCREHPGNLIGQIKSKGHRVHTLTSSNPGESTESPAVSQAANKRTGQSGEPAHAHWLGTTQEEDAASCATILIRIEPDWLVVDHYALDERWEQAATPAKAKLMVIDDLADRPHSCDLLLDQNLGRANSDYEPLVPARCTVLTGPSYALLRPEFAQQRPCSLARRRTPALEHVLITMGGIDRDNATGRVLEALKAAKLPKSCRITVVMGAQAPWLQSVRRVARTMPWPTQVQVNIPDMAGLMAQADLAIGAAGSTSWERCCLGLPTLMMALAENQIFIADNLHRRNVAISLGDVSQAPSNLCSVIAKLKSHPGSLTDISSSAAAIVDGTGTATIVKHLLAGSSS